MCVETYDGLQGTRCKQKRNHANKKENAKKKQIKTKTRKQKRNHANKKTRKQNGSEI